MQPLPQYRGHVVRTYRTGARCEWRASQSMTRRAAPCRRSRCITATGRVARVRAYVRVQLTAELPWRPSLAWPGLGVVACSCPDETSVSVSPQRPDGTACSTARAPLHAARAQSAPLGSAKPSSLSRRLCVGSRTRDLLGPGSWVPLRTAPGAPGREGGISAT